MNRDGHSISYYECINKLETKGIQIPKLPNIDLLHTERNLIYHLGNKPDTEKAKCKNKN